MKKLKKLILAACCMLVFFSCKKQGESVVSTNPSDNRYSKTVKGDTIIHKLAVNGNTNTILEIKGEFYVSDDMKIYKEQFDALKKQALLNGGTTARAYFIKDKGNDKKRYRWPNGIVYFSYPVVDEFNGNATPLTQAEYEIFKNTIDLAMKEIADSTGIQFKPRVAQPEYLRFVKSHLNNAFVGYFKDNVNQVNIEGIDRKNTVMHEILHALGLYHEHQRPDRDLYLTVDTDIVRESYKDAFKKLDISDYKDAGTDFDYESIMLYSRGLGCVNGGDCITRADGTPLLRSEEKPGLSKGDAAVLRALYPINGEYKITNDGFYLFANSTSFQTMSYVSSSSLASNYAFTFTRNTDNTTYSIKAKGRSDQAFTYNPTNNTIALSAFVADNVNQRFRLNFSLDSLVGISPDSDGGRRIEFVGGATLYARDLNNAVNGQKIKLDKVL